MKMQPSGHSPTRNRIGLLPYVSDFRAFGAAMMVLAEEAPERMTLSQALFFVIAGTEDLMGREVTFSRIKEAFGDQLNRSLHSTYRILMSPSRQFPSGLGWLQTELSPYDNRVKLIQLTPKGEDVMRLVYRAMKGI